MKCKSKLGPSPHQTESAAVTLQAFIQGYQARKLFGELQRIREIQRNALNQYCDLKSSVLTLQSWWRMILCRRRHQKLKEKSVEVEVKYFSLIIKNNSIFSFMF